MGVTAIVTGAGGPAGVAVIRALRQLDHRVVGADADPAAVGLHLADHRAVLPLAADPAFAESVCDLALASGATVVVSTLAEEMLALSRSSAALDAVGVAHWFPAPDVVATCVDKWRFATACAGAGLPVPPTALGRLDGPPGIPGPWIVKPRFGRGSRHVYEVDYGEDPAWVLRRVPEPLWQTRVTGREFTVDILVDRDGTLAGAVPRWRTEVKAGISTKGCTFADPALVDAVRALVAVLGLTGPANAQGFVTDSGAPVFVEVNPRFSGGLPLSLAAGADLVGQYLQGVLGQPVDPAQLAFEPGMTMSRCYEEVFVRSETAGP